MLDMRAGERRVIERMQRLEGVARSQFRHLYQEARRVGRVSPAQANQRAVDRVHALLVPNSRGRAVRRS